MASMFLFVYEHTHYAVPLSLSEQCPGQLHELDALKAVLSECIAEGSKEPVFFYNSSDELEDCPLIVRAMEKYKEWRLQPAAKKAKTDVSNDDSNAVVDEEELDEEIENYFIQNLHDELLGHDLASFPGTYAALFDWTDE